MHSDEYHAWIERVGPYGDGYAKRTYRCLVNNTIAYTTPSLDMVKVFLETQPTATVLHQDTFVTNWEEVTP